MNFIFGLGCIVYRSKAWSRFIGIAYTTSYVLFISYKYFAVYGYFNRQEPQLRSGLYVAQIINKCYYYLNGVLMILLIIVTRLKSEVRGTCESDNWSTDFRRLFLPQKLLTVTKMIENCDRKIVRMGLSKRYSSLYRFQVYALTSIVLFITIISVSIYFQQFGSLPTPMIMKLNIIFIQNFMWIINITTNLSFHVFVRYERLQCFNTAKSLFIGETIGTWPYGSGSWMICFETCWTRHPNCLNTKESPRRCSTSRRRRAATSGTMATVAAVAT